MSKKQLMNLIGAGTMTALIVITGLLFNGGVIGSASADNLSSNQAITLEGDAALQAENAQLRDAVIQLQDREAQYAAQIDEANQLLQEQSTAAAAYGGEYEEEEYEEEEEEEEEEYEEHEEHEEGEEDDD